MHVLKAYWFQSTVIGISPVADRAPTFLHSSTAASLYSEFAGVKALNGSFPVISVCSANALGNKRGIYDLVNDVFEPVVLIENITSRLFDRG